MKAVLGLAVVLCLASGALAEDEQVDNGDFKRGPIADDGADSVSVPGLSMGLPTYGGAGCRSGTASSVLSPDQRTLSVLFDAYTVRAGGPSGPRARTGCTLQIPFNVPAGYRVKIVTIDYRGFASIPAGGGVQVSSNFGYLGMMNGKRRRMRFNRGTVMNGPLQENFTLSSRINGPPWSPCGTSFVLQADSSVVVGTNRAGEEVLASIDSLDAATLPVRFALRWAQCSGDEVDQPGPRPGHGGGGGPRPGDGPGGPGGAWPGPGAGPGPGHAGPGGPWPGPPPHMGPGRPGFPPPPPPHGGPGRPGRPGRR